MIRALEYLRSVRRWVASEPDLFHPDTLRMLDGLRAEIEVLDQHRQSAARRAERAEGRLDDLLQEVWSLGDRLKEVQS